jgi:hypothetical protein
VGFLGSIALRWLLDCKNWPVKSQRTFRNQSFAAYSFFLLALFDSLLKFGSLSLNKPEEQILRAFEASFNSCG